MQTEEIRRQIVAQPFQPFRPFALHMADGRKLGVYGQDFILLSPTGRYVNLYQPTGELDILDAFYITGIGYDPPPPPEVKVPASATEA
jgi:hypothetical protein